MAVVNEPYQLLTTTRYDPLLQSLLWNNDTHGPSPFFLLPLHFARLLDAADMHNWFFARSTLKYNDLKSRCMDAIADQRVRENNAVAFKVRITVSVEGQIVAVATPLPAPFYSDPTRLPLQKLPPVTAQGTAELISAVKIYLDTELIEPSVFTQTKTTFRTIYDQAKSRNEKAAETRSAADWDVLLYNQDGEIMETSIYNVAFYRSSTWLTPSVGTGCLPGVMRRWLIENGRVKEDTDNVLTTKGLEPGEWVLLFNGVQGCRLGNIWNVTK